MSNKVFSLGNAGSATGLLAISGATNATPIVITLAANHGLKNGDRIAIAGVTGNTNANGEWTLASVGATTATLLGSVGNGAFGGTVRVATIFDTTPGMRNHSAACHLYGNGLATLLLEAFESYAEFAAGNNAALGNVPAPVVSPGIAGVTNTNATSASGSTVARCEPMWQAMPLKRRTGDDKIRGTSARATSSSRPNLVSCRPVAM